MSARSSQPLPAGVVWVCLGEGRGCLRQRSPGPDPDLLPPQPRQPDRAAALTHAGQAKLYPAEQAMLRVVSPDGHVITAPIEYKTTPVNKTPARDREGTGRSSYFRGSRQRRARQGDLSPDRADLQRLKRRSPTASTMAGWSLPASFSGMEEMGGRRQDFQCLAGNPPRLDPAQLRAHPRDQVIHDAIYGWWNETTTTYAWHGPRLVKIAQSTLKRRVARATALASDAQKASRSSVLATVAYATTRSSASVITQVAAVLSRRFWPT